MLFVQLQHSPLADRMGSCNSSNGSYWYSPDSAWVCAFKGQMLIWDGLAHNKSKKSQHVNPCQSTGVWFTEPTPTTLVFLDDLLEWLLAKRNAQWDQAAWNEVG